MGYVEPSPRPLRITMKVVLDRPINDSESAAISDEMIQLFMDAGYDETAQARVDYMTRDGYLIVTIGGEDETACAVIEGILKTIFRENGLEVQVL